MSSNGDPRKECTGLALFFLSHRRALLSYPDAKLPWSTEEPPGCSPWPPRKVGNRTHTEAKSEVGSKKDILLLGDFCGMRFVSQ